MKIAAGAKPAAPVLTVDRAATARLVAALDTVLDASDSISKAVTHFSTLPPEQAPPPAWVERAVELHVALLEAWWALDDEAAIDAAAGGWTVGPPHAIGTPLERRRVRTFWELEWLKPQTPVHWWDKQIRALGAATTEAAAEEAGRALVAEGSRRRYANWHETAARDASRAGETT
jgi:hypothetical protein